MLRVLNNILTIFNNHKLNITNINDLNFKHYLLTPDMREDEVLSFKARHGVNTADRSIKNSQSASFFNHSKNRSC